MDGRTGTLIAKLDHEPKTVVIDPFGSLLAKWNLDLPASMLIDQAKSGPTPMSRFNAIAALASHDRDDAREVLKSILLDDSQNYFYRTEAADALGKMHANEARDILLSALAEDHFVKEPHVRRAAIGALLKYRSPKVAATELRFAKHDESGSVEAIASDVLGEQEPTDAIINQLIANTKEPSFRDEIRSQAVSSLGEIGDERGLKPAMELASYGEAWRIRPPAISAVGKIGSAMKDKTEARKFLIGLLDDSQDRPANVAIRALGELGDEKAIDALEMIANSSAPESKRHAAQQAIDTINKHEGGESGALRALRERVETLEKAREDTEQGMKPTEKKESPTTAPSK
jgi:HEAT repeat protein